MTLREFHCQVYMLSGMVSRLQAGYWRQLTHSSKPTAWCFVGVPKPHQPFSEWNLYYFFGVMPGIFKVDNFTHVLVHGSGGRAFLVEHRGDWKWLREAYSLSTHWSAGNYICHVCFARGGKNPHRWSRILWLLLKKCWSNIIDIPWRSWSMHIWGHMLMSFVVDDVYALWCLCIMFPEPPKCHQSLIVPIKYGHLYGYVFGSLPSMFPQSVRWTQLSHTFQRRSPDNALANCFRQGVQKNMFKLAGSIVILIPWP